MQFDLVTLFGIGAVISAAILLRRHFSGDPDDDEFDRLDDREQDVDEALKSKRKD